MFSEQTVYKDDRFPDLQVMAGNNVDEEKCGIRYEMLLVRNNKMRLVGHVDSASDVRGFAKGFFETLARAIGLTQPDEDNVVHEMFVAGKA